MAASGWLDIGAAADRLHGLRNSADGCASVGLPRLSGQLRKHRVSIRDHQLRQVGDEQACAVMFDAFGRDERERVSSDAWLARALLVRVTQDRRSREQAGTAASPARSWG
jgi:hypothetical protein